ncbi:hypothetical protein AB0H07_20070 [Streptomyces sp. NPDC021354]|uniref:hypothetical protein n=1 Tax=Streptomyces sp. NPDC021354 TaxID=3154793 RepID=UPI0033FE260E
MPLRSSNSGLGRGITAALILLTAGTGAWWAIYDSHSDSDTTSFPETLCNHRISGDRAEPLLPNKGTKPQEDTYNFNAWTSLGHCIIKSGGETISVTYEDALGEKRAQRKEIPVSLGDAYGYMSPRGSIELYLSCKSIPRSVSNTILIGTNASVVQDKLEAGSKLDESTSGLSSLAAFTAQAVRDLTQNWFRCPGADKLPDGPVTIHWDKPAVR